MNEIFSFVLAGVVQMVTALICALAASAGFWAFVQKKDNQRDAKTTLLLGLAHDRIVDQGLKYIERGWIAKDEYHDLNKYLYGPYSTFGGNGLAEKIMAEVAELPIHGRAMVMDVDYMKGHSNERNPAARRDR
mgnify:FL=1